MNRVVEYTPRGQALIEGYAIKHTAHNQTLTFSPEYPDWTAIDLGNHPDTNSSRTWVLFNSDWQGETLNARLSPDGSDADPSYQDTISSYEAEQAADPTNVGIIEGTEHTIILRRTTSLRYFEDEPINLSEPEESDL